MAKNIEININNGSNSYEILYPKSSYTNMSDTLDIGNTSGNLSLSRTIDNLAMSRVTGNLDVSRINNLNKTYIEMGSYIGTKNSSREVIINTQHAIQFFFLWDDQANYSYGTPVIFTSTKISGSDRPYALRIYGTKGVYLTSWSYYFSNNYKTIKFMCSGASSSYYGASLTTTELEKICIDSYNYEEYYWEAITSDN